MIQNALSSIIDGHLWRIIRCCLFAGISFVLVGCASGQQNVVPEAQAQVDRSTFDCTVVKEIPLAECQALIALYTATNGPHWAPEYAWLRADRPCTWQGVSCGKRFLRVFFIRSEQLSNLIDIDLDHNELTEVTSEFCHLTKLMRLDLMGNPPIKLPPELDQLPNLEILLE